jgi:type II secretory pathway component GspD/PulD (secretin)
MILEIGLDRTRQWGVQWHNKKNRTANMQLSGFWGQQGPVTTSTPNTPSTYSNSIIANLIGLAKIPEAGTTILTLGKNSIYAIAGILESDAQTRVIANPFIVATNKYRASVAIAEERRAKMEEIKGGTEGSGEGSFSAKWEVSITPQINDEGVINLDIDVILEEFANAISGTDAKNANKKTTRVQTNTNVANKEVIALGGLIKKKKTVEETRFPILSRIPIIGNLFKNTLHENEQTTLVILMSPTIIYTTDEFVDTYTQNKAKETSLVAEYAAERHERNRRDPIYNWFFKAADDQTEKEIRDFVYKNPQEQPEQTPLKSDLKSDIANKIIQSAIKDEEGES